MRAARERFDSTSLALALLALATACAPGSASSSTSPSCPASEAAPSAAGAAPTGSDRGDLVIVGRIMTMDEPPIAEALLINGGLVTCVGTRDLVLERAGDDVPVVDIGTSVAYPGFIDAHAHWIGDRDYYDIG